MGSMRRWGVLLLVVAGLGVPAATALAHPEPGDVDGDGVGDQVDNCPQTINGDQQDTDRDRLGDRCDTDADNDGVPNPVPYYNDIEAGTDNCPLLANVDQEPAPENPTFGKACYVDADLDGHPDPLDNCPAVANPGQEDFDFDRTGDICDPDDDFDGEFDAVDNCPRVYNWEQTDADGDGIGAACDANDTPPAPALPAVVRDTDAPALRLTVARTLRLSELGRSIAVAARCDEACSVRAELLVKRRRVAAGTASLGGAGTTYVFMRRVKRLRPARATVRLTATDPAGNERRVSRVVRMRR
jgi:hypothetical protein